MPSGWKYGFTSVMHIKEDRSPPCVLFYEKQAILLANGLSVIFLRPVTLISMHLFASKGQTMSSLWDTEGHRLVFIMREISSAYNDLGPNYLCGLPALSVSI